MDINDPLLAAFLKPYLKPRSYCKAITGGLTRQNNKAWITHLGTKRKHLPERKAHRGQP